MQQAAKFWDKAAPSYAKSAISDIQSYEITCARTQSYLKKTDRIYEAGCGTGGTARLLAPSVAHVTATDFSGGMIDIAKQRAVEEGLENVDFRVGEINAPDVAGGPFDVVLAHNVLHLVEDMEAAVRGLRENLKPGGLFISKTICAPENGATLKFYMIRAILPIMQLLGKAPFVQFKSIADFDRMIEGLGFKILETGNYPAKPPSRYIVARKI